MEKAGRIENNKNFNKEQQEKLIIDGLYDFFIPPKNPNNPRKTLPRREYTLNYLATRIGVDPLLLLSFFRKKFWRGLLTITEISPNKIIIFFGSDLDGKDTFEDFKKRIIDLKNQSGSKIQSETKVDIKELQPPKAILSPTEESRQTTEQLQQIPAPTYYSFEELDQIKELTFYEKEYLRLLLEKNPKGIFAIRRSGIRASKLDANLAHIHYNLLKYARKWKSLGILRKEGYKFRILIKKDS